jgi:1,4-dihydroxy-2-naphthoyl-CoA synthase
MEEAKQGGILMAYGNLKVEKEGNIALLIIDRPELKNALNLDLLESISQAFTDLEQDKGVNAVVLTGSDEVFCAGFDMNTVMNLGQDKMQKVDLIEKAFLSVLRYPMPVIAAVSGPAIAAGFDLVYYQIQPIVYQALANNEFVWMQEQIKLVADKEGLEYKIFIDQEHVYLQFTHGDQNQYYIMDRNSSKGDTA